MLLTLNYTLLTLTSTLRAFAPKGTDLQIGVNVAYQALENIAYLAQHGVVGGIGKAKQARLWAWSSRFWAAHVALDLGRVWRLRRRASAGARARARARRSLESEKRTQSAIGEVSEVMSIARERDVVAREEEEEAAWWREVAVNLAYAPLTVHWSLERGLVSDGWVGAFGSMAGLINFRRAWSDTTVSAT